jgi:HIP---CoA ligase
MASIKTQVLEDLERGEEQARLAALTHMSEHMVSHDFGQPTDRTDRRGTHMIDERADLTYQSIPNLARVAADRFGDAEAVVDGATRLSFIELRDLALQATRALMANGVEPGDRVAIWAPNCWEWIVASLGILGAGGWMVPLNTRFKGDEAAYVLEKADVKALFTVSEFLDNDYVNMLRSAAPQTRALEDTVTLRGQPGEGTVGFDEFLTTGDGISADVATARIDAIGPDDVADVMFTSGTTGRPKGVMLGHGQSLRAFDMWGSGFGLTEGDRHMIIPPFFHCFGYKGGWMLSLLKGATTLPVAAFDAEEALRLIRDERVTALPGPPTVFTSILDRIGDPDVDASSLRIGFVGAASVPAELLRRMRSELPFERVTTGYGLTESTAMLSITRHDDDPDWVSAWSGGVALPGLSMRIVDDDGHDVAHGEPGELMLHGWNVMRAYYEDPDATAEAIDEDGWLHTGDIAVMCERGDFKVTDRKKDMYITGGFNVYPAEVESLLLEMGSLSQVAIIGMSDDRMGEVGAAFVIPRPGAEVTSEAVIDWARQHIANFKVPRRVEIVNELPLNASGKVLKGVLRERLAAVD